MGILGNNPFVALGNPGTGYQIEQSLRFDGSSYLSWTPGSAGNRRTSTFSVWFKYSTVGGEGVFLNATGYTKIAIDSGGVDKIWFQDFDGTLRFRVNPSASYRDPSAWYHLVAVLDTTNATSSDRVRIYINGTRVSAFDTDSQPSQNFDTDWSNNVQHRIGADTNPFYFSGYMAEAHFVDGTALDPEAFGEYDDNGVWRPIAYTGSHGTNGFYLTFNPGATNGIGHDHSGNGNNFSPTGFSTSGTGTDVMSDTPTTNWCTFNPLNSTGGTLSNGNLDASGTSNFFQSTIMVNSGKYYFEFTKNANGDNQFGIAYGGDIASTDAFRRAWRDNNGTPQWLTDGVTAGSGTPESCATDDVVGVALDMDNSAVYFSKNGTYMNSGDPTSGSSKTGAIWTDLAGQSWGPMASSNANGLNCTLNCGQRAFEYTPPTGFNALNTANLPAPDIADGSDYFDIVLWTGNQTARTISMNSTFTPDFIWIKNRTSEYNHSLQDVVRGFGPSTKLSTNTNAAENSANNEPQAGYVDSAAAGSFDIDASATATWYHNNLNSNAYVGWSWLAGGSVSADNNTAGSITSTVSANPTAGFSIVTYTGTGVNATVGHGLGVKPSFYVVKPRSEGNNWPCWHKDLTSDGYYIHLNFALKQDLATAVWNGTGPSDTVFNIGTNTNVNQLGATFVAYCFAEIEAFSKISSWSGNGSTDGPFVHCGFRPAFLLLKNYRGGSETDWIIQDSTRSTYNVIDDILRANTAQSEASGNTNYYVDFLSNGFKIRTSSAAWNESGSDYLFLAFAENPFGGFRTTPATAR